MKLFFSVVIILILWIEFSNHYIVTTEYIVKRKNIPHEFHNFKILHLSDLHGDFPKWKMKRFYHLIDQINPDIIVVTGDVIDHLHQEHLSDIILCLTKLSEKYSIYYVTGNHEYMHRECNLVVQAFETSNIHVLHNEKVTLQKKGEHIVLYGNDDPYVFYHGNIPKKYKTPIKMYKEFLSHYHISPDDFCILLAHRPEFFEDYEKAGFQLIFTGHAHGGQWRFPGIPGVIAPDQGLFPKYTKGLYQQDNTTMVVSRGLGNSIVPLRIFNRPEIVLVTLEERRNIKNEKKHKN